MLIDVLNCVAITCIIVHSEIFRPIRELLSKAHNTIGYWIHCPMCFGFWVGLVYAVASSLDILSLSLMSSLFSWVTYNIVTAFDAVGDYYTTVLQNGENNDE